MGTKYIIDASIAVKWIVSTEEKDLEQASTLFHDIVEKKIEAVSLNYLLVEVSNVLLKGKNYTEEKIFDAVDSITESSIKFISIDLPLIKAAIALAPKYHQTIYDALYLALAQKENAKVITADKKLMQVKHLTLPLSQYH